MSLKKLNKDSLALVNKECLSWLNYQSKMREAGLYTDAWFVYKRERDACWGLIKTLTGLDSRQVDNLIYNKVNTSTFWLPDGTIRPNK
jgi:hypothetical protein